MLKQNKTKQNTPPCEVSAGKKKKKIQKQPPPPPKTPQTTEKGMVQYLDNEY